MMVETATWDDWSTIETRFVGGEDKWHVALAPGEVKVLSLEQLDDLFRLSIVDAETKVWQSGMSEWQPLGVLAGIEQEAPGVGPKRASQPPRSPPPPPLRRSPAPLEAVYAQPIAVVQPRPVLGVTAISQFPSVRPLVVSQPPRPASNGGGGLGRFLVGLALIAGVSVTLYRNGVVRDAARSFHQDRMYARLQASLGGPPFGTLASIEQSTALTEQLSASATSPITPAAHEPHDVSAAQLALPASGFPPLNVGEAPRVISLESLRLEPGALAGAVSKAPVAKPEPVTKPVLSQKKPLEKAEASTTPLERLNAAIGASVKSNASANKKASKSRSKSNSNSNEYDPLNPTL